MAPSGLTDERAMVIVQELVAMQGKLGRLVNELEVKVGARSAECRGAKRAEKCVHDVWVVIEGRVVTTDGETNG